MAKFINFKVLAVVLTCVFTVTCSPQGRNDSSVAGAGWKGGEEAVAVVQVPPPPSPPAAPAVIAPADPSETGAKQVEYQPAYNVGYESVDEAEREWEAKLAMLVSKGQMGGVAAVQALMSPAAATKPTTASQTWGATSAGGSGNAGAGSSGVWEDPTMSLLKPYIQNVTATYEETKAKWWNEVANIKQMLLQAAMSNQVAVRHPGQFQRRTLFFPFFKPSLFDLYVISRFVKLATIFVVNTAVVGLTVGVVTKLLAMLKLLFVKKVILIG